jgi:cobalt/nickel transport system permease protein
MCQKNLRRINFIDKTLAGLTEALKQAVFAERYARLPGLLQGLDPRGKIVTFAALLIFTAMTRQLRVMAAICLLTIILALMSRIPLLFFLQRVWLFIPLFTGAIALPAIFNFITPGRPLATLMTFAAPPHWGPIHLPANISITAQGLRGAEIFILRVGASVSLSILLILTTEWARLLRALAALRFPRLAILIFGMTYRYIFLFIKVAEEMFLARRSRTVGRTNVREQQNWLSNRLGFLLNRSTKLSNEVYLAMLSRGWNGQARFLDDFRFRWQDAAWTIFVIGVIIILEKMP